MRGRIREEDADLAKPGHGDHPSPGDVGTSIWSLVHVEAEGTWRAASTGVPLLLIEPLRASVFPSIQWKGQNYRTSRVSAQL